MSREEVFYKKTLNSVSLIIIVYIFFQDHVDMTEMIMDMISTEGEMMITHTTIVIVTEPMIGFIIAAIQMMAESTLEDIGMTLIHPIKQIRMMIEEIDMKIIRNLKDPHHQTVSTDEQHQLPAAMVVHHIQHPLHHQANTLQIPIM